MIPAEVDSGHEAATGSRGAGDQGGRLPVEVVLSRAYQKSGETLAFIRGEREAGFELEACMCAGATPLQAMQGLWHTQLGAGID